MKRNSDSICLYLGLDTSLKDSLYKQASSLGITVSALARLMLLSGVERFEENPLLILKRGV